MGYGGSGSARLFGCCHLGLESTSGCYHVVRLTGSNTSGLLCLSGAAGHLLGCVPLERNTGREVDVFEQRTETQQRPEGVALTVGDTSVKVLDAPVEDSVTNHKENESEYHCTVLERTGITLGPVGLLGGLGGSLPLPFRPWLRSASSRASWRSCSATSIWWR